MKKISALFLVLTLGLFVQAGDLTITAVFTPINSCQLTANEIIQISVYNTVNSPHPSTAIGVNYSLNNGPVQSETINTLIGNYGIFTYSFLVTDDFSACQIHDLKVWITDVADTNAANDTIAVQIISDCPAVPGTITGPAAICSGNNSGTLNLVGYNGVPFAWETSPDGITWTTSPTTNDFFNFTNITNSTIVRAIVDSPFGLCGMDTTAWFTLNVDAVSDAGNLPADFDICDNGNAGIINVSGNNGTIQDWIFSTNAGVSWTSIANTSSANPYSNLTSTTQFQIVVQNGVCPPDTSTAITLNLIPGSDAGIIVGESLVCNFDNDSSLDVTGTNGTLVGWDYSLDNGGTWTPIIAPTIPLPYSGLNQNIMFQVVVQLGSCPPDTAIHSIIVLPVDVSGGPNVTINEGDTIQLAGSGGITYDWFPTTDIDDPAAQNPLVWPASNTVYFVEVTDMNGCTDSAQVVVTVLPDVLNLTIPNLITPNGDGYNDAWQIGNIDTYTKNEVVIFNIYGQVVYESKPYNNDWAGTFKDMKLPDGTYFYQLNLNDPLFENPIQGVVTVAGGN